MNKNLTFYVKKINNFLSKEVCDQTLKELKNQNWEKNYFHDPKNNILFENGEDSETSRNAVSTNKFIMDNIYLEIDKYLKYLNFNWYKGWNGYSSLKFNKYEESTQMVDHCDHTHTLFKDNVGIPILSLVCLLNNDFEGGEFIMFEDTDMNLNQGDLIIFPSIFLFPHRVNKVKKNTRYSFVSWVY